jgi:hypothetical protein
LTIRQDFSDAVRPVFFETDFEEFLYATHGGTMFIVSFRGRVYGLTCRHVFGDFEYGRLVVTNEKHPQKGSKPARVKAVCYPSSPRDGAVGTDIIDICVIEFVSDVTPEFFGNSAYMIDDCTIARGQVGHKLLVAGVLKEKTLICSPDIYIGYCQLEFVDVGISAADPILRTAGAEFPAPSFSTIVGTSGSPVFDVTANALCGMVVRGGMTGRKCTIHYIDIFDIAQLLQAVSEGASQTYYTKHFPGGAVAH